MPCSDCVYYEKKDGTCHEWPPPGKDGWPPVPPEGWCGDYIQDVDTEKK